MPEQEQWTLPSMDKGDVWEQTATVPSAVAGYYLAGLSAETTGPAAGPYMADTTYSQAWMYVSDNGSQTTEFFDESIFPEGTLPMPDRSSWARMTPSWLKDGRMTPVTTLLTSLTTEIESGSACSTITGRARDTSLPLGPGCMAAWAGADSSIPCRKTGASAFRVLPTDRGGGAGYTCPIPPCGREEQFRPVLGLLP